MCMMCIPLDFYGRSWNSGLTSLYHKDIHFVSGLYYFNINMVVSITVVAQLFDTVFSVDVVCKEGLNIMLKVSGF